MTLSADAPLMSGAVECPVAATPSGVRRVLAGAAHWAVVTLPLALAPLLLFPRLEWMAAALLVPLAWTVSRLVAGRFVVETPINVLLLPLVLMVAVSLWATFDVAFSLGKVAGVLLGVFVFFAVVEFAEGERRWRLALAAYLAAGAALGALSLVGTTWKRGTFPVLYRLASLFPVRFKGLPGAEEGFHPNPVGASVILFILLAVLVAWLLFRAARAGGAPRPRGRRVLALLGGTASLAVGLFLFGILLLSQSRASWAGFGAAVLFTLVAPFRRLRYASAALVVLGIVVLVVVRPQGTLAVMLDQPGAPAGEINLAGRYELWSRALYGIQDFPFTGMGMNTFRKVVHVLYPLFLVAPGTEIAHAHNHVLQAALDLGIPGLVAYLGIWTTVAVMLARVWCWSRSLERRLCALGLGGGLLAQFLAGMADAIPLGAKVGILWWVALGVAAALYRVEFGELRYPRWRRLEVVTMWVLVSLASIAFVGDRVYVALGIAVLGSAYLGWLAAGAPVSESLA